MILSIVNIFVAILSILLLVVIHELGHFLLAKKFGVRVEEFGIGLPPRLVGKKIGETLYSLNALPVGAFVKMTGEEKRTNDPASFSIKPLWQRMSIVAGGVVAFWIVAIAIFSVLGFTSGIPTAVDDASAGLHPRVQILSVSKNSPAFEAGIEAGDILKNFTKVSDIQNFTQMHKGQKIMLTIERGKKVLTPVLVPRINPPEGEGSLGVVLSRTAFVRYPWYKAPVEGVVTTYQLTARIAVSLFDVLANLAQKRSLPQGVEVSGPIGIVVMLTNFLASGPASFFAFLGILSVYLAIFNALPIPAVDGGRLVFLVVEFFRKKPIAEHIERNMVAISFGILMALFIYVTVHDITRLF